MIRAVFAVLAVLAGAVAVGRGRPTGDAAFVAVIFAAIAVLGPTMGAYS